MLKQWNPAGFHEVLKQCILVLDELLNSSIPLGIDSLLKYLKWKNYSFSYQSMVMGSYYTKNYIQGNKFPGYGRALQALW